MTSTYFPFSAVVGQPQLKTALLLCAVDPTLGGVLIRGDKGTAKSTAARALTNILPPIERVAGCALNCLPGAPCEHCETCDVASQAQLASVPFVTLPLGATEDRVLGTLDLQRALQGGKRAFQPGLLASAHRGILYIDEVNLLADHLVDVLLDVAAMGVNSVQREGLSVSHPARFTLVGTMNLEEGDLRPQLLDRFGLMVEVAAPRDKTLRAEVVRRRIAYETDPPGFADLWTTHQEALRSQLATAQQLLPQVVLDDALLDLISHLCCEFDVASLRADIVMHKASRALAALDGRKQVKPDDVRTAAELVLPHRRRRKPFEQPNLDKDRLDELMQKAAQGSENAGQSQQAQSPPSDDADRSQDEQAGEEHESQQQENEELEQGGLSDEQEAQQVFVAASASAARQISAEPKLARSTASSGRRSEMQNATRGRVIRVVPNPQPSSLAVGATLRSAALRDPAAFKVTQEDLHQQIRIGKSANLILFVVDASGSMAAQRRMEAVKGAVLALLTDAYQRRDEVAVISFRGERASLLLSPTRSVERAEVGMRELPTGGRTPLPHALSMASDILQQRNAGTLPPLMVLLSDGKANVAMADAGNPWRETLELAGELAQRGTPALVIDTETGYLRLGRAAQLADALGAECITLEQLSAENLAITIRGRLSAA